MPTNIVHTMTTWSIGVYILFTNLNKMKSPLSIENVLSRSNFFCDFRICCAVFLLRIVWYYSRPYIWCVIVKDFDKYVHMLSQLYT